MDQVEIAIVEYTLSSDYLATVGADFDVEAADNEVLAKLNEMAPAGVVVHRNGKVFADEGSADEARSINWDEMLARIDINQVLANHGR